jgi:uncharacterized repeat protein (TIGR02543 family)
MKGINYALPKSRLAKAALAAICAIALAAEALPIKAQAAGDDYAYIIYNRNNDSGGGNAYSVYEYPLGSPFPPLLSAATVRTLGWESEGLRFAGWSESPGGSPAYIPPIMVQGDVSLYAVWEKSSTTYKVSYNANGGMGSLPVDSTSYQMGDIVRVKGNDGGLSMPGYIFAGWSLSKGSSSAITSFSITANATLYAIWSAAADGRLTVSYSANGGTGSVPSDTNAYPPNTTVTVKGNVGNPPLTRKDYVFAGFSLTQSGSPVSTFRIGSNTTLYAVWSRGNLKVAYNANGGEGSVPKDTAVYAAGDKVTVKAGSLTKEGSKFGGWSLKKNGQPVTSFSIAENTTLYAVWENDYLTVSYSANGGSGTVPIDKKHYQPGDTAYVQTGGTLKKDGFGFAGWATSRTGSPVESFEISKNTTLYAIWAEGGLLLTFDANGGMGDPPVDSASHAPGEIFDLAGIGPGTLTRPGFTFGGWSLELDGSPVDSVQITGAVTLYAVWEEGSSSFVVQFDGNGGTVTDEDALRTVTPLSPKLGVDMPLPPTREGYEFSGWNTERDGSGLTVTDTSKITASAILYAQWDKKSSFFSGGLVKIILALLAVAVAAGAGYAVYARRKPAMRRYRHY